LAHKHHPKEPPDYHHHHHHHHEKPSEDLRLEAVVTSVGFDDILDVTLSENHPNVDTLIVVTAHNDTATQAVCKKHGAMCVQTDLFKKNGRNFNKGAAINAGFGYFQYRGWRLHLDSDIILPSNFRRMVFNHTHLDTNGIYGADRVNVIGLDEWNKIKGKDPQASHRAWVFAQSDRCVEHRYVDPLEGYLPIGYFQMWHSSCQKPYPYSMGDASHDDTLFSALWPKQARHLLSTAIVYHICSEQPTIGQNWDGNRKTKRLEKGKK
jgi:hypothetical protein